MNTTAQTTTIEPNPEILDDRLVSLFKMTNDVMMKLKSHTMEDSI